MIDYLKFIELTGGFLARLLGLKKDRKLEVAGYLESIADELSKFPSRVRAGAPYDELAGLAKAAEASAGRFGAATDDVLGKPEAELFSRLLSDAANAKEAAMDRAPEERDERLRTISEVAGSLRGAAAALRGSASKMGSRET